MKNYINKFLNLIMSFALSLATIGSSVILVLNLKVIYNVLAKKLSLDKIANVSLEGIIEDYKTLINYLQNPRIDKLKFNNFYMSDNGEFHFYEVKNIFLGIYLLTIISILILLIYIIYKKYKKKETNIIKIANNSANIMMITFGIILGAILIDFSKAFVIFHEIFFNNDYWIFDPYLDPIIMVLPEYIFMIYAIIVIALILGCITLYKVLYYKKIKNK